MSKIPESEWEQCPACENQGGIPRPIVELDAYGRSYVDWEEEQCEFCWEVEESIFNQRRLLNDT